MSESGIVLNEGYERANPKARPQIKKMKRVEYEELMHPLWVELLKVQDWVKKENKKISIVFEGRDAGGKGGTLKRFIEFLNPRGVNVIALDKPTDKERNQWYFQRYVETLPTGGDMNFYDRSWYNRGVVERVMGFADTDEVKEYLRAAPQFEKMLTNSGMILFKLWFSVSQEEQMYRFNRRMTNPLKQWKLSPVDKESQGLWDKYTVAKTDMLYYTSSPWAPWTIVKSDDKKRARINAIRYVLSNLDYPDKDESVLNFDKRVVMSAEEDQNFSARRELPIF
ncbi:MAG: polyphosphate kinase 2 [Magnetococcales bacterium]|nr:polyphosphate kinase 2 [Magnetococcales bacterium]